MQIKMINPNKVSEENKKKFFDYMEEASKEFHDKAYKYLDGLYSIKNALYYRPKKLLIKICCYIIGIGIMIEFANAISDYINIILYSQNLLGNCLLNCLGIIIQLLLLVYILYGEMVRDSDYRHECYIKFINSDCVKQYEEKLLKKAFELNIELEVIRDEE